MCVSPHIHQAIARRMGPSHCDWVSLGQTGRKRIEVPKSVSFRYCLLPGLLGLLHAQRALVRGPQLPVQSSQPGPESVRRKEEKSVPHFRVIHRLPCIYGQHYSGKVPC